MIEVFQAHDIGFFFYNGGGNSQDTAYKVSQIGADLAYPIVCVGIPKTVDNDLPITDCSPGFGSAAKYVATSIREAAFDVASIRRTSTKVFALEVMGRHAGWTTAACALAAEEDGGAPHILLLPEVTFNEEPFLAGVETALTRYGHCVIAVSEGIKGPDGEFLSASGSMDTFGHTQLGGVAPVITNLISAKLGCKSTGRWLIICSVRHATLPPRLMGAGLRSWSRGGRTRHRRKERGDACDPPAREAPYRWDIVEAPLSEVANQEKLLPPDFISADGFGITEAARRYLAPLIVGEPYPPFKDGLPCYVKLRNAAVPKKLATQFAV